MAIHYWFVISNPFLQMLPRLYQEFQKSLVFSWACIYLNHQSTRIHLMLVLFIFSDFEMCCLRCGIVVVGFSSYQKCFILQINLISFPSALWIWAIPRFIMLSLAQIRLFLFSVDASDFLWTFSLFFFFWQLTVTDSCMLMWGSI